MEAGAGFDGKFVVGVNGRAGVAATERGDEPTKRLALLSGSRVGGVAVGVESADVDYADAFGILSLAMRPNLLDRTTDGDTAVEPDDVVVADATESARTMPRINFSDAHSATDPGRRTMDNDFCDFSHSNFQMVSVCVFLISNTLNLYFSYQREAMRTPRSTFDTAKLIQKSAEKVR